MARTWGPKIISPMHTDPMAAISTAPAATSFAFSASGWNSGEATSVRNSNAVLRASAVHTEIIARIIQHHSDLASWKYKARNATTTVAAAWIHALCCEEIITRMPLMAHLRLLILPVNVRLGVLFIFRVS